MRALERSEPARWSAADDEPDSADELDLGSRRWCVDAGDTLECLTTEEVWSELGAGRISTETRIWREGFGAWLEVASVAELAPAPPLEEESERVSIPERSESRPLRAAPRATVDPHGYPRRPRSVGPPAPTAGHAAAEESPAHRGRSPAALSKHRVFFAAALSKHRVFFATALSKHRVFFAAAALTACSMFGGAAIVHVAARPEIPRARRAAVDVAELATRLAQRVEAGALEREAAWWRARWR